MPFADLAAAQAAIDGWVSEYNTTRPHQAIGMAVPAERFSTAAARAEQQLLPLRLPAVIALAPVPPSPADPPQPPQRAPPCSDSASSTAGGPVEFERVVPASGNMQVRGKQFWLGTARSGMTVTFWASTDVIHLTIGGGPGQVRPLAPVRCGPGCPGRQRRTASGPPPLPPAEPGAAIEVDRVVSKDGQFSLGGRYSIAAEILGGRLVSIRIEDKHPDVLRPRTPACCCGPGPAR